MAQFKTIVEAVLDNGAGEIDRVELTPDEWFFYQIPPRWARELSPGDTIRIIQRETEVV